MKKVGSPGQELLLTAALARFRDVEMAARNLSPETRRGYGYDLSEWVATTPPSLTVAALSTDAIARYLRPRRAGTQGIDPPPQGGRPQDLPALPGAGRRAAGRLLGPAQLARGGARRARALSMPEYTALLREAGHHPRDAAILELLLQTGIRLAELTALSVADVTLPTKPSSDPVHGYGLLRVPL